MAKKKETNSARRKDKKPGLGIGRRKSCACCKDKIVHIDYKDVPLLKRFTSERGKIRSRGMTGLCRRHPNPVTSGWGWHRVVLHQASSRSTLTTAGFQRIW